MMQNFANSDRLKARFVLGLLVLSLAVFAFDSIAHAQSNRELQNRIDRLENEIETLSRALFRGEDPPAGSFSGGGGAQAADIEIRLSQLETELRTIRGQLEEQNFEMRNLREELERVKGDLELRMQDLEGGRGSASSTRSGNSAKYISRQPTATNNNAANNDGYRWRSGDNVIDVQQPNQLGTYNQGTSGVTASEDLAAATYENAFALLKKENYEVAEKEFQIFLDQYPNHVLAGNAQYWLGETHYVRGDYETAARLFAEGFQKYPGNSKTADNLLKLGMSLAALDKTDDACVALSQIEKEGFQAAAPVLRRANQEKSRLGCSS